jgi:hypothetical protein
MTFAWLPRKLWAKEKEKKKLRALVHGRGTPKASEEGGGSGEAHHRERAADAEIRNGEAMFGG